MQKNRQFFRWIEEAEARTVRKSSFLQRGVGEPTFAVVSTEPGLVWRGRIRALFGNVDGCASEPKPVAQPVHPRPRPLPLPLRDIFD